MKLKSVIVVILFLLLFEPVSFGQLIKIEKNNCRVSNSDLQTIEKIARFEKDLYNNLFNTKINDTILVKVNILNAADYNSMHGKASGLHKTLGFYTSVLDECFILKQSDYLKTVIHEMSHCYLWHNLKKAPRWLHEGIAEFCGSMLIEDDKVSYAADAYKIRAVRDMVIVSPLKLKNFMSSTNQWSDLDERSANYAISYAVIYFLIKKNPSILKRILLMMQEGENSVNAIEYNYGGFAQFENDFNTFYKNTLIKPY